MLLEEKKHKSCYWNEEFNPLVEIRYLKDGKVQTKTISRGMLGTLDFLVQKEGQWCSPLEMIKEQGFDKTDWHMLSGLEDELCLALCVVGLVEFKQSNNGYAFLYRTTITFPDYLV